MWEDKKLRSFVEKLVEFNNVNVQFKREFKNRRNKKVYIIAEDKNGYQLERKIGNKSFRLNLKSTQELKKQKNLSEGVLK